MTLSSPEKEIFDAFVQQAFKVIMDTYCRWNQAADDVLEHWRAKSMTLLKTNKVWPNLAFDVPRP